MTNVKPIVPGEKWSGDFAIKKSTTHFPLEIVKFQKNVRNPNHHYFSKKYRNTPPICIAIRLPFVPQYFWCPYALRKGNTVSTPPICIAVRLPFVLQYASHLYRNTFGKILVVVVTECSPKSHHLELLGRFCAIFVEISFQFSPGKQGVSETLP